MATNKLTFILALATALASSSGFWQTIQRAAFESQAEACGRSVVALANVVGDHVR